MNELIILYQYDYPSPQGQEHQSLCNEWWLWLWWLVAMEASGFRGT